MVIKKLSTNALDQQIRYLQQQITDTQNQLPSITNQYELLTKQAATYAETIQSSTQFFTTLNWPLVNEIFTKAKQNDQQIRELHVTVRDHADDATRFRALQEEKQQISILVQQTKSTIISEEETLRGLQEQIARLQVVDSA